ncbi:hypothetical protein M2281_004665 [Mesorhizobium soli]|uniref:hypothetical protein n=1 Tax=Pseudaminobacter soli (ex Li et al. 2025) TaxID=1295366 RepID=UPI002473B3B2|nr:hypothetical protein [Mesorhizobium soli]MDH6234051.1 hypothetical protein [Mesorhizobium soli]
MSASTLTPVPALLARLSTELNDMAAEVNRLYPLAIATATPDPDYLQALQGIDHIEQKLRALAGFLADLTKAAAPDWQLDAQPALAALTLSDLATRLAGHTPHPAANDGDCELF